MRHLKLYENFGSDLWYHGTNTDFDEFDMDHFGETDAGWYGKGIYFHSEKDRGGYGNIVKTVKLHFKNPLELPAEYSAKYLYDVVGSKANLDRDFAKNSVMNIIKEIGKEEFMDLMVQLGYDGMIVNYMQGTKEAVVYDTEIIEII